MCMPSSLLAPDFELLHLRPETMSWCLKRWDSMNIHGSLTQSSRGKAWLFGSNFAWLARYRSRRWRLETHHIPWPFLGRTPRPLLHGLPHCDHASSMITSNRKNRINQTFAFWAWHAWPKTTDTKPVSYISVAKKVLHTSKQSTTL